MSISGTWQASFQVLATRHNGVHDLHALKQPSLTCVGSRADIAAFGVGGVSAGLTADAAFAAVGVSAGAVTGAAADAGLTSFGSCGTAALPCMQIVQLQGGSGTRVTVSWGSSA